MTEAIKSNEDYVLPVEVGVAITAHIIYQLQSGSRVPDPNSPEDVQHVADTILNHTDMSPEDLAEIIPAVKVCMSLYSETNIID